MFLSHSLASGMESHGKARPSFQGTDPGYITPGKEPQSLASSGKPACLSFPSEMKRIILIVLRCGLSNAIWLLGCKD